MEDLNHYYAVLGLSKDASIEDIQNSFNSLSNLYNPSRNPNADGSVYIQVNQAYNAIMSSIYNQSNGPTEIDYNSILNDYIRYGLFLYHNQEDPKGLVCKAINDYKDGNVKAITRDCNFRDYFKWFLSADMINQITNYNTEEYVTNVMNMGYDASVNLDRFLLYCFDTTYKKYGEEQLANAIDMAYTSNDFRMFSDGDARNIRNKMNEYYGESPYLFKSSLYHLLDNNIAFSNTKGIGHAVVDALKDRFGKNQYEINVGLAKSK